MRTKKVSRSRQAIKYKWVTGEGAVPVVTSSPVLCLNRRQTTVSSTAGMNPQKRRKNRKPPRRRMRKPRVPPSLRPTRLAIRHIVPYSSTSGSAHRWYYSVRKNWLVGTFLKTFDEFKIVSIRMRYVPNNATNETGLYTCVILDRKGFGAYGSATASQWFSTIGAMPGSKIRPRYAATMMTWRPTEPSVRDWVATDADITYCTAYVCNNGLETNELGGLFEISAIILARGLYYDAKVREAMKAQRDNVESWTPASIGVECDKVSTGDFESLNIEDDGEMLHPSEY